ncbi:Ras_domain-containing protein [Hexamita inflata]|uniref:Ras domain-containing protein n=1 Tax=Hexamita inflata TaxID=28002 RepID=A0AA86QAS7_9EUKA|nr:Ras domain-containing protein [Hexamita inflata]
MEFSSTLYVIGQSQVGKNQLIQHIINEEQKFIAHDTKSGQLVSLVPVIVGSLDEVPESAFGLLLVYNITNNESFEQISEIASGLVDSDRFPFRALVGTFNDQEPMRAVSLQRAQELKRTFRCLLFEVSNTENTNMSSFIKQLQIRALHSFKLMQVRAQTSKVQMVPSQVNTSQIETLNHPSLLPVSQNPFQNTNVQASVQNVPFTSKINIICGQNFDSSQFIQQLLQNHRSLAFKDSKSGQLFQFSFVSNSDMQCFGQILIFDQNSLDNFSYCDESVLILAQLGNAVEEPEEYVNKFKCYYIEIESEKSISQLKKQLQVKIIHRFREMQRNKDKPKEEPIQYNQEADSKEAETQQFTLNTQELLIEPKNELKVETIKDLEMNNNTDLEIQPKTSVQQNSDNQISNEQMQNEQNDNNNHSNDDQFTTDPLTVTSQHFPLQQIEKTATFEFRPKEEISETHPPLHSSQSSQSNLNFIQHTDINENIMNLSQFQITSENLNRVQNETVFKMETERLKPLGSRINGHKPVFKLNETINLLKLETNPKQFYKDAQKLQPTRALILAQRNLKNQEKVKVTFGGKWKKEQSNQPAIIIEFEVGDQLLELPVRADDNAYEIAQQFVNNYNLDKQMTKQITALVMERLNMHHEQKKEKYLEEKRKMHIAKQFQIPQWKNVESHFGQKKTEKPLFKFELFIGNKSQTVAYRKGDDAKDLADKFCNVMKVNRDQYYQYVVAKIQESIALYQMQKDDRDVL